MIHSDVSDILEVYHILDDKSSTGKSIEWSKYKVNTGYIAQSMKRSKLFKRAWALEHCGQHLVFEERLDESLKLVEADFCRDRLCPMCTWRRSLKLFGQTQKLMNYITGKVEGVRYIFLTFTIRNVTSSELSESISSLVNGFSLLLHRKEVRKSILGACRHIEVTFNSNLHSKSYKTFHPHLHVVFAVPSAYFFKGSGMYIPKDRWCQMWKECVKADYDPLIDVQAVDSCEQEKAVAELCKYPVKMDGLLKIKSNQSVFDFGVLNMAQSLVNRRLIEYYGIFRKYRRELKLEDLDKGDLISTDIDEDKSLLSGVIHRYQWRSGLYVEVQEFD